MCILLHLTDNGLGMTRQTQKRTWSKTSKTKWKTVKTGREQTPFLTTLHGFVVLSLVSVNFKVPRSNDSTCYMLVVHVHATHKTHIVSSSNHNWHAKQSESNHSYPNQDTASLTPNVVRNDHTEEAVEKQDVYKQEELHPKKDKDKIRWQFVNAH